MIDKVKIGTRGSPLALWQAKAVQAALGDVETEIVVIKASGDWSAGDGEVRLSEVEGGKGQFAKEIEQALLGGAIDIAVHSMKDMDSNLPKGLVIDHMLPREDARDAFLSDKAKSIDELPEGARVGTASVRRAAFLLSKRPDVKIEPLRGNVATRIDKMKAGQVDATFLALAGLKRLGLESEAASILSVDEMLPAAGQGAVGIEMREGDTEIAQMLAGISCERCVLCVKAEREALRVLDGSCHTPIGAYAVLEGDEIYLRVQVSSLDGSQSFTEDVRGHVITVTDAFELGRMVGERLKQSVPAEIFQ